VINRLCDNPPSRTGDFSPGEDITDTFHKKLILFTLVYTMGYLAFVGWRVIVRAEQGWIGMTHEPSMDSEPYARNVLVATSVYPGGPAARSGVQLNQWLTLTFNGAPVKLERDRPGDPNQIEVLKDLAKRAKVGDSLGFVTIENPLKTPGIIVDLLASLFVALTSLFFAFYLWWTKPQDRGASVFFVTAVFAASYSFLDGLRPLDTDTCLGCDTWVGLDLAAWILWASRLATWLVLFAVFQSYKNNRGRMRMLVLGTLLAALLIAANEYPSLIGVSSHPLLLEVFSKTAYWMFLLTVGLGILYSPPEELTGVSSQPVAA